MFTLFILILWTWGLTPLVVNIIGTVICGLGISFKILTFLLSFLKEGVQNE